eukprot:2628666-Prymnesium_polylepis.1
MPLKKATNSPLWLFAVKVGKVVLSCARPVASTRPRETRVCLWGGVEWEVGGGLGDSSRQRPQTEAGC